MYSDLARRLKRTEFQILIWFRNQRVKEKKLSAAASRAGVVGDGTGEPKEAKAVEESVCTPMATISVPQGNVAAEAVAPGMICFPEEM